MASYPADANVLQVDDFDALGVVTGRIRDAICNSKFQILSTTNQKLFSVIEQRLIFPLEDSLQYRRNSRLMK